jgi:PPOX class probable F420-dependent enzyme
VDDTLKRELVAAARVGRLGTVTPAGAPHLVPCCFALDGDVLYTAVDGKPKTTRDLRRLANVRANPASSLLVDHYDEDWAAVWWVRVDGTGRVLGRGSEHAHAHDVLRAKYEQYAVVALDGAVIAIDVHTWRGWSAADGVS